MDAWLLRACAVLGIKLVHSRAGRVEVLGKIEGIEPLGVILL